jgi:hypothetical protein
MGGWIKRHWLALFGAIPLLLPTLSKWIMWLIGRGGDADFIISRIADPGWIRDMLNFMLDPPSWANLPLIAAGLLLIWLDVRRRESEGTVNGTTAASRKVSLPYSERVITSDAIEPVRELLDAPIIPSPPPPIVNAPIVGVTIAPSPAPIPSVASPEPSIPKPTIKAPEKPPKEFVDVHVTPEFLVGLYEGQTMLGAETRASNYKGKWMSVSGPLLETVGGYPFLEDRTRKRPAAAGRRSVAMPGPRNAEHKFLLSPFRFLRNINR